MNDRLLFLIVFLIGTASTAYAELDVDGVNPQTQSRSAKIKTVDGQSLEGTASLQGDSLVIQHGNSARNIKLADIATAEFREIVPPADKLIDVPSAGGLKAKQRSGVLMPSTNHEIRRGSASSAQASASSSASSNATCALCGAR